MTICKIFACTRIFFDKFWYVHRTQNKEYIWDKLYHKSVYITAQRSKCTCFKRTTSVRDAEFWKQLAL